MIKKNILVFTVATLVTFGSANAFALAGDMGCLIVMCLFSSQQANNTTENSAEGIRNIEDIIGNIESIKSPEDIEGRLEGIEGSVEDIERRIEGIIEGIGNTDSIEGTEHIANAQSIEGIIDGIGNTEDLEGLEGAKGIIDSIENIRNIDNTGDIQGIEGIEGIEGMENTGYTGNIEDVIGSIGSINTAASTGSCVGALDAYNGIKVLKTVDKYLGVVKKKILDCTLTKELRKKRLKAACPQNTYDLDKLVGC